MYLSVDSHHNVLSRPGLGSNPVLVELVLVELDFRYSSAVQLVLRISSSNPVELEKMRYSSSTELE